LENNDSLGYTDIPNAYRFLNISKKPYLLISPLISPVKSFKYGENIEPKAADPNFQNLIFA